MFASPIEPVPPVTESPWFWVLLFSLAALAGIATIGPKFERRASDRDEISCARARAEARGGGTRGADRAGAGAAVGADLHSLSCDGRGGCVALVAFVQLIRLQRRRWAVLRCKARMNYSDDRFSADHLVHGESDADPGDRRHGADAAGGVLFEKRTVGIALASGCGVGVHGLTVLIDKLVVTDREQVQSVIYDAARQAEKNNLQAVIDCISPSAASVRAEARRWIGQAKLTSVTIGQLEVTVDKSKQPWTATAHFWVRR